MPSIERTADWLWRRRAVIPSAARIAFATGILTMIGYSLLPALESHWRLGGRIGEQRARNAALRLRNEGLRREADALQNDPQYIERVIREDLHMMGPEEFRLERKTGPSQ